MRKFLLFLGIALATPALALAGSQSYTTPGTYTFTVPAYQTLTVTLSGGGGGGGGGYAGDCSKYGPCDGGDGTSGGSTSFGGVVAQGGTGGAGGGESGAPFTISQGGGTQGGAGGAGEGSCDKFGDSCPMGQNGGSGALVVHTYTSGELTPGSSVTVKVGGGGASGGGGSGEYGSVFCDKYGDPCPPNPGGSGANGSVSITWTSPNPPPTPPQPNKAPSCSITFDQNPLTGDSTTMHWTSQNATLFYINNVGYVAASGSAKVWSAGDYSGTVSSPGGTSTSPPSSSTKSFSSPGTYQWTAPEGVTSVTLTVVGAGGGGAGTAWTGDGAGGAGGGGGGAYVNKSYSVSPNATYTVVVGAGGAGGIHEDGLSAVPGPGGNGGNSSFSSLVATGGAGGTHGGAGWFGGGGAGGSPGGGKGADSTWYDCETPRAGGQNGTSWGAGGVGDPGGCYSTGKPGENGYVSITWAAPSAPGPEVKATCAATLASPKSCPAGQYPQNGSCVSSCSPGYTLENGMCVLTSCPNGYTLSGGKCDLTGCPAGQYPQNSSCVSSCSPGYTLENGACVFTGCPANYTQKGTQCVLTSCPDGYTLSDGECVVNKCGAPTHFCKDGTVYYGTSCSSTAVLPACDYGCSDGECIIPPPPQITAWSVTPILVKSGETVTVKWDAEHVAACTVHGTNGDGTGHNSTGLWDMTTSLGNGETSSGITGQTIYTLSCTGEDGSATTTSTTVNVVPSFVEH